MRKLHLTILSVVLFCSAVYGHGLPNIGSDAEWISVPSAPVYRGPVKDGSRAMDGTSWFVRTFENRGEIARARWTVSGLGVFEVFVNGNRVGDDILKPGFTHYAKTKYSFSYDVTELLKRGRGETNIISAEVSAGWWRDKIVTPNHNDSSRGFIGDKSAFIGILAIEYADGSFETVATDTVNWRCGVAGSVVHAAIFDGEEYDARVKDPVLGEGLDARPEANREFKGKIFPSAGAEVTLRRDLSIARGPFSLKKGGTLVVDFGQNCAAVPEFNFTAKRGTVLTVLPGEMLNDADKGARGCDGPKGSVYRANLREPDQGMRIVYTFAGDKSETYMPRFTFFGYRYLSLSATEDVEIESIVSVPVTSVKKEMEIGKIETGDKTLNKFIENVYWGQLSNYLSVPTDCPQRSERLGWSADTQIFCEAGSFNADTRSFFRKFTRDLRDSQDAEGGFSSVAPFSQYGNETFSLGWADVGVIVPWTVWRHFGDESIVRENWEAMSKFVRRLDETKYDFEDKRDFLYADWLSFEKYESCGNKFGSWLRNWRKDPGAMAYRRFLAACYWLYDARLMAEMAKAIGKNEEGVWFESSAARALGYIRGRFLEPDGLVLKSFRDLQTACVFALKHGIVEGQAREETKNILVESIRKHGGCLQTGFLGTGFIMDALTECGAIDVAYSLLLQHNHPSWLYSVDQGATTVWERWNSYTKADGFGPVSMNSFNHYAYGAVLAWIYRTAAGIAPDSGAPGFRRIVMAPKPDRRLGYVRAEYKSAAGLIKSEWRYEGDEWVWEFTIPDGAVASVTVPGEKDAKDFVSGSHIVRRSAELCRLMPEACVRRPVKVIFDTDMYEDYDDVAALACLHALSDAGECEILATVANTRSCMSIAMCEIINAYYGRSDIPVGCAKGIGVSGASACHRRYYAAVVDKYAKWVKHRNSSDAPDANLVYRKILAAQPDGSVTICSVGFLTNLRRLLETAPDEISPLSGMDLVARKVKQWVAMACRFPAGRECNALMDPESSRIAFEKWPTPIVFTDFNYGCDCFAGRRLAESNISGNPVADVFKANLPPVSEISLDAATRIAQGYGLGGRSAWDETAVLIAVRGIDGYFSVERGCYRMVGTEGENLWTADADSGPHLRICEKMPKIEVGKVIDELMMRPARRLARECNSGIGP